MKMKLHFESQVHFQRLVLGVICGLLPILCVLFGLISCTIGGQEWYLLQSVSETYYTNHKIIMITALGLCTFFFTTYKGYDIGDRIFTALAALGSFGVAAFPCWSLAAKEIEGLFSLPILTSNTLHMISACLVFGSFAIMTITQFTKGNDKKRNIVYYVCGAIMLAAIIMCAIRMWLGWAGYWVMVFEFIMLEAFAVAWITKSKAVFTKGESNEQAD